MITVLWDTWVKPNAVEEGLRLSRKVWSDMRGFEGFLSYQLLMDQDHPGHIVALGHWRSREDADRARILYAESPTIRQLTSLLARARERWVMEEDAESQDQSHAA